MIFLNKNWFKLIIVILTALMTISVIKISFYGINIVSVKNIEKILTTIQDDSKIIIKGKDLDIEDKPLWIHIETLGEYNYRLDRSIKHSEHQWKMQHDNKYRQDFEKGYDEFLKKIKKTSNN